MRYVKFLIFIVLEACSLTPGHRTLEPRILVKKASVDPRFQSYNLGAIEHINLKNKKLRTLVTALGPSYIKNDSRLSKNQWKELADFAQSVDAKIIHSYGEDEKIGDEVRKLKEELAGIEISDDRNVKKLSAMLHEDLPGTFLLGPGTNDYQILSYQRNCSTDKIVEARNYLNRSYNYLEGKPVWMTGTTGTSCIDDSSAYLEHLGQLSQHGIKVVMLQSLIELIDMKISDPRPVYWSALLWNRFMGKTVLNPGPSVSGKLKLYAHCMKGSRGGVTLLVINTDKEKTTGFDIASPAVLYTLHSHSQKSASVRLNGQELKIYEGSLPEIKGEKVSPGEVMFAPSTINFITIPEAGNQVCYFD